MLSGQNSLPYKNMLLDRCFSNCGAPTQWCEMMLLNACASKFHQGEEDNLNVVRSSSSMFIADACTWLLQYQIGQQLWTGSHRSTGSSGSQSSSCLFLWCHLLLGCRALLHCHLADFGWTTIGLTFTSISNCVSPPFWRAHTSKHACFCIASNY